MALIDCHRDQSECGNISIIANLSPNPVRIDVQYPGNEDVWYTLGALTPTSKFEPGPGSISFPGSSLLRASKVCTECQPQYFMLGRITEQSKNVFYIPKNAML